VCRKLIFLISFVLVLGLVGNTSANPHPYLTWVNDPSVSIVVNWWNPIATGDSTVEYGKTASYGSTAYNPTISNFHHVELTGLTPGTTYHYRISSSDGTVGSDETFTVPVEYPTSFMFAVFGDSRGVSGDSTPYHNRHKAQCDHIATKKPGFVLHLGDMVNEGSVENDWVEFFNCEQNLSKSTVIMPVLGNHEVQPGGQPYYYYFDLYNEGTVVPNNGMAGKGPRTYSFDYGNTHHIIVSSYQVNKTDERNWIEADLAAAATNPKIDWIFAYMHKAVYTSGPSSAVDTDGQKLWVPLFEQYGVDIVFGAHWHFYERSYPLKEGLIVSPEEGVLYITSALAGGPFNCQEPGSSYKSLFETYYCNKTAAVYITINKQTLTGQLVTVDDEVVDTFTISKYEPRASQPSPVDGAKDVALDVVLSWSPGTNADKHDVYFGTNPDDVNNADVTDTTGVYRGRQDANNYTLAGVLERGVTYCWRVDEVNELDPNSPYKGEVWSFTVPAETDYNPDPPDGALCEQTWVNLRWWPGKDAVSHNVYFGNNFDDVKNGTGGTYQVNQTETVFTVGLPGFLYPDGLIPGTTYYWRIDEVVGTGRAAKTLKGNVWSFTLVPKTAYNLSLADGLTGVKKTAILK